MRKAQDADKRLVMDALTLISHLIPGGAAAWSCWLSIVPILTGGQTLAAHFAESSRRGGHPGIVHVGMHAVYP